MAQIFLENITNKKTNIVEWDKSINKTISFQYGDISGEFIIRKLKLEQSKVQIEYLGKLHWISICGLLSNSISKIVNIIDKRVFNIGDIIELNNTKVEVLKTYRDKSNRRTYTCKCLKCGHVWNISNKSIRNNVKCTKCSKNVFRLSDDKTYWIGLTQNNEEFLFSGSDEIVKYIKSCTWRKTYYNYFQNSKGEKLHRVVMNITDSNIMVNHLGGNRYDCREEKLSISNCLDNSREKNVSARNKSGIVGLLQRGNNNKYVGAIRINGVGIYTSYKERDEALIDLLIIQKHYEFRHNQHLWNMISNVSEERCKEMIDFCEKKLLQKRYHEIQSTNRFELSEDKTFYWVYDSNNNKFKISLEAKEIIKNGLWYVASDKNEGMKCYVKGCVLVNNVRKSVKLHRYLLDLLNIKYKNWVVDHINGDGTDNRFSNLIITNTIGNGHKNGSKGYGERSDRLGHYRVNLTLGGIHYDITFSTPTEAEEYVKKTKEKFLKERFQFHNKEELDNYLIHNTK